VLLISIVAQTSFAYIRSLLMSTEGRSSSPDSSQILPLWTHLAEAGCKLSVLNGGAANYVARVAYGKHTGHGDKSVLHYLEALKGQTSVIVKQAPPFLAKAQHIEFSTYRQVCH
jgi:hypothetical protein